MDVMQKSIFEHVQNVQIHILLKWHLSYLVR